MVKPNETSGFFQNDGIQVLNHGECNYVRIKLDGNHASRENAHILVSSVSYKDIIKYKWYLGKHGYPVTYQSLDNEEKFGTGLKLHKMLLGLNLWVINQNIRNSNSSKRMVIDHINRNKLDNRLENLRICSAKENSYNTSKRCNKENSKYKGVKKQGKSGKWIATITKDGNMHEIRDISTEKEAAQIYDLLAENLFGDYAGKNFS